MKNQVVLEIKILHGVAEVTVFGAVVYGGDGTGGGPMESSTEAEAGINLDWRSDATGFYA
jgi:hypothetical protein